MRWLLLLILIGCSDPFAPTGAVPFTPAVNLDSLWAVDRACSGLSGDWHRITWFEVPGYTFATPHGQMGGWWSPPHTIYLAESQAVAFMTIRHEMLHDLLQRDDHPPVFAACGVMP